MLISHKQQGFTLIELLVVIAIIGLLSSIVLVAVNSGRSKARDSQRKANLTQLAKALELYYNVNQSYPNTSWAWWAESPSYGSHPLKDDPSTGQLGWIPGLAPTYVSSLPHDSYSGQDRTAFHPWCYSSDTYYFYISNGTDYKLLAYCTIEQFTAASDPFQDPRWYPMSFGIWTQGAANW